ncbi:TIGR03085 family metal-binding protein [Cellulomonas edaphi]|uniref:TIGR03085 family metal-binding protein n=1 Tax=Cellulomonas edaphi TaxID=3053468 RepID=A0ABT7S5Y6_9CELL|nr:TIGR03085 family metal-binding protein [Cellulomons edaphi]MDM7831028.1 TIGR03085 family metal-binding protein [Cellulomons edaphi]
MTWHPLLRAQLADALREVSPEAPTLCEGWQARHVAAHVVLRESSATVPAALVVPGLASRAESAIAALADTARSEAGYRELVDRVAAGPSRWNPVALGGDLANLVELFVHGEDVRRGSGPVPARQLDPPLVEALWEQLLRSGGMRLRRLPVGVVLVRDDGVRTRARKPRGDHGTVVVRGAVPELVLWALGRGAASDVRLEGDPADVSVLGARLPA